MSEPYLVAGDLSFRPIGEDDVDRIVRWLADPEVGGWWEGVTFDHDEPFVRAEFIEQRGEEWATKAIVELDHQPIGFQQWYLLDEPEVLAEYDIVRDAAAFGIDQFIGESRLHNQGIGTRQVRATAEWLLGPDGPGAKLVVADPVVENLRAVRCYEKAGFRKVKTLPAHSDLDGEKRDSWLMEMKRRSGRTAGTP